MPLLWWTPPLCSTHESSGPSLASPSDILPSRDCVRQEASSCEAVGPGQPLLAVVTELEHAVLSLLAPLLGAQSMCYNNKPKNPNHTLPYLKICNENIWSKCIQSGNRAESHTGTELLIVTPRHDPFALWIQTSHVLKEKQQPEDGKSRSCLWDQPAVLATLKSLGFHPAKKPAILSSKFIWTLSQLLSVWLFSFKIIILKSSKPASPYNVILNMEVRKKY